MSQSMPNFLPGQLRKKIQIFLSVHAISLCLPVIPPEVRCFRSVLGVQMTPNLTFVWCLEAYKDFPKPQRVVKVQPFSVASCWGVGHSFSLRCPLFSGTISKGKARLPIIAFKGCVSFWGSKIFN